MSPRPSTPAKVYASEGAIVVHYDLDVAQARLSRRSAVSLPATVQAGWAHPGLPRLYIASSNATPFAAAPRDEHFLTALQADSSGKLSQIGESVRLGSRPVHMCLDRRGRHALVAYNDPANLTVHPIADDGSVGGALEQPAIALRKYPHQIKVSPADDLVVVCARGNDPTPTAPEDPGALHPFSYRDGRIREALPLTAPNGGFGFGPRNLDFHPTLPVAYVALERQNEVQAFGYGEHGFDPLPLSRATTLFGAQPVAKPMAGMVRAHPNGRFLYVANRTMGAITEDGRSNLALGGDDIAVFAIDPSGGQLTPLQRIDSEGVMPRTFGFDPSGRLLVVANHVPVTAWDGGEPRHVPQSLMLYRIGDDGRLTRARKYALSDAHASMFWTDVVGVGEAA